MNSSDLAPNSVTRLLLKWREGDEVALGELLPLVYDELRRLARLQMRGERQDHTLQPTAVVHEAYARLVDLELPWQDRTHFLCMAAQLMRRVLVDYARAHQAEKRRGGIKVSLHDAAAVTEPRYDLIAVNEVLERLRREDERLSRVIELHYFGGLSYLETAETLGLSAATVDRHMRFARAWIRQELERGLPRGHDA